MVSQGALALRPPKVIAWLGVEMCSYRPFRLHLWARVPKIKGVNSVWFKLLRLFAGWGAASSQGLVSARPSRPNLPKLLDRLRLWGTPTPHRTDLIWADRLFLLGLTQEQSLHWPPSANLDDICKGITTNSAISTGFDWKSGAGLRLKPDKVILLMLICCWCFEF